MKKALLGLALLGAVSGCTATEQGAAIGGGGGALVGAVVASPGREAEGALVGGAIGAVTGALIGQSSERRGYCEYRDRYGRVYVDDCPTRVYRERYPRPYYDGPRYRRPYYDDDYYN